MNRSRERAAAVVADLLRDQEKYQGRARADLARLWRSYVLPYTPRLLVTGALTVVWSAVPFAFALTWRFLVDDVLRAGALPGAGASDGDLPRRMHLALLFFGLNMGLWTILLVTGWTRSLLVQRVGRDLVYSLRKRLHEKLQVLHINFFERTTPGRIISRVLDDVGLIQQWVTSEGINAFSGSVKLLIGMGLTLYLNWRLSVVLFLSLPVYLWAYTVVQPKIRETSIAMRRLSARMYGRAGERIAHVGVVKSFGREKTEARAFAVMVNDMVRIAMRLVLYNQGIMLAAGIITALTSGVIIYVGASEIRGGALSLGSLMAFLQVMYHVFEPVNMLTGLASQFQQILVAVRRVFALLDEPVDVVPGHISLEGMSGKIEFDRVTFRYPSQAKPAIHALAFQVRPGERIALMGPSGAGKTTVFELLLRFYDPREGAVRVGGVDLREADPRSITRHVRMVQQEPVIFSGTIADNIRYGNLDASPADVMRAAQAAELHEFILSLQVKYETEVGENGVTLSGGQRQRLALATALLTDPEVLLLDDTTSALDAETETRIRATLNRALKGRTSLTITQRAMTARDCDRILVLDRGRLVQEGTHQELISAEGFYRAICEKQGLLQAAGEE